MAQHQSDPDLNGVFTYIAQEVARLLQQSHSSPMNREDAIKTINGSQSKITAIRAIEPEYKFIFAVEPLSARELEVLQLIVDGHRNGAIARQLYISVGKVKSHVRSVLRKLCVRDRTQAAIRALRAGFVH